MAGKSYKGKRLLNDPDRFARLHYFRNHPGIKALWSGNDHKVNIVVGSDLLKLLHQLCLWVEIAGKAFGDGSIDQDLFQVVSIEGTGRTKLENFPRFATFYQAYVFKRIHFNCFQFTTFRRQN